MDRIGPRMLQVAMYVKAHRGCTKYEVAANVGPRASVNHGYSIVQRAIDADLIANYSDSAVSQLCVTRTGWWHLADVGWISKSGDTTTLGEVQK